MFPRDHDRAILATGHAVRAVEIERCQDLARDRPEPGIVREDAVVHQLPLALELRRAAARLVDEHRPVIHHRRAERVKQQPRGHEQREVHMSAADEERNAHGPVMIQSFYMVRTDRFRIIVACSIAGAAFATLLIPAARARSGASAGQAPSRGAAVRYVPDDLQDTSWLKKLGAAQAKAVEGVKAFHDFTFTDRRGESGITFQHHVVADAARTYKAAHYDHGNGLAIADVDGDGLTDIYFLNQVGGNQLWKNAGGGRFQDITASAGVAVPERVSVTASFADIDNDGDADLYVTTVRGGNLLFENDGKGRFRDITAAAGLTYVGHSSGAVFFDY